MAAEDVSLYRKFQPQIWDSPAFMALPQAAKFLYLYLSTGPCTTNLPGLFRFSPHEASAPDRLAMSLDEILGLITALEEAGFVQYDRPTFTMWVVDSLAWSIPANPNVVKGWTKRWNSIPSSPLKSKVEQHFLAEMTRLGGNFLSIFKQILNRSPDQVRANPTSASSPPAQATRGPLESARPQVTVTPPTTLTREKVVEEQPPGNRSGNGSRNGSPNGSRNGSQNGLGERFRERFPEPVAVAVAVAETGAAADIMSHTERQSGAVASSPPAAQQEQSFLDPEPSGTHRIPHNTATAVDAIVAIFKTDPLARAATDLEALAVARQCESWAASKGVPVQELPVIVQQVCEDLAAKQLLQSTFVEPKNHARWIVGACRRAIAEFRGEGIPDAVAAARERRERAKRVEEAKAREEAYERRKEAHNQWFRENTETVRGLIARVGAGGRPDFGGPRLMTMFSPPPRVEGDENDE